MTRINVIVDGTSYVDEVEPRLLLVQYLREQLGKTGTVVGCDTTNCGACTVHLDGQPMRSCVLPVSAVTPEQKIVTIEGLSPNGTHPVQVAWRELDVPQCGFCQPGMIMASAALLAQKPKPTDDDINTEITNICRCGTYNRVRAGIKLAAEGGDMRRG